MDKKRKIMLLRQEIIDLEEEIAFDVNTAKDQTEISSRAGDATANDIEEFGIYKCEGNNNNCLFIKSAIGIVIIIIAYVLFSYT